MTAIMIQLIHILSHIIRHFENAAAAVAASYCLNTLLTLFSCVCAENSDSMPQI